MNTFTTIDNAASNADTQANLTANNRAAYQGELLFTAHRSASADSWETGLNNNVLVLGCSGGGKTRHHVKPNLLERQGSYIVLDSKGQLYREMAPYLFLHGYAVDRLDFTTMNGTVGYNPLEHVRIERGGRPNQADIITIARAICPKEDHETDPFWPLAAANYLASYIAYVFEALEPRDWNMASVIQIFERACAEDENEMFMDLAAADPDSYAFALYRRARTTRDAGKMHSSIMGIIAANLLPLSFDAAMSSYRKKEQVRFSYFGEQKRALFVTMDDLDHSLAPLTSLFIQQAFTRLCSKADNSEGGRLRVPARFILDDFANLNLPHSDDVLSVIRSREISCTVICQTVSQLEARYGKAAANSIIGNCDRQLVTAFQDERTASYFATRANKPASALLETPANRWWYFERGQHGVCDKAYCLEDHPAYAELRSSSDDVVFLEDGTLMDQPIDEGDWESITAAAA